ncbi:ABC transporter ATP-binding protein [Sneathiella glossodoripedis]|uniref:ABC transporter ATP-binding protein n=1 Tax=Sneathiella glossodoripedis TaxID=418853 RepID=UPI000471D845|nr:ATP-binding cassette domain-containing protein [Sneathiella glossodoripedis]
MTQANLKIRVRELNKSFSGKRALDKMSLDVRDGEILTLIGPSGAGKSLLLKTILGLVKADSGGILVNGEDARDLSGEEYDTYLNQFGVSYQRSGLFDGLPVWENIGFRLLQLPGNTRKIVRDLAADKLRAVGLSADLVDHFPSELSGGMQKRVGIARALVGEPSILFLDEPTAGLDPIMSNVINELIVRNVRELGSTAIVITSNLVTARFVSDRIAMMHEGRQIWCGDTDEVSQTDDPYVYQFWHKKKDGPIRMPVASMTV